MSEPATEAKTSAKIKIDGIEYDVPEDFTLGEMRTIKRFTGLDIDGFEQASGSDPDAISALVYIILKRADPDTTEEAVEGISISAIEEVEGDAGPPVEGSPETEETPEVSGAQT